MFGRRVALPVALLLTLVVFALEFVDSVAASAPLFLLVLPIVPACSTDA